MKRKEPHQKENRKKQKFGGEEHSGSRRWGKEAREKTMKQGRKSQNNRNTE